MNINEPAEADPGEGDVVWNVIGWCYVTSLLALQPIIRSGFFSDSSDWLTASCGPEHKLEKNFWSKEARRISAGFPAPLLKSVFDSPLSSAPVKQLKPGVNGFHGDLKSVTAQTNKTLHFKVFCQRTVKHLCFCKNKRKLSETVKLKLHWKSRSKFMLEVSSLQSFGGF